MKGINKKYIQEIVNRNEVCKNIDIFYDSYYHKFNKNTIDDDKTNNFVDLIPSLNFYKNYEPDLSNIKDLNHWYKNGINEFHRKTNVNYIDFKAEYNNYFVAGTIFGFNKMFI